MKNRQKVNRKAARRDFSRTARATNRRNGGRTTPRGGIRL